MAEKEPMANNDMYERLQEIVLGLTRTVPDSLQGNVYFEELTTLCNSDISVTVSQADSDTAVPIRPTTLKTLLLGKLNRVGGAEFLCRLWRLLIGKASLGPDEEGDLVIYVDRDDLVNNFMDDMLRGINSSLFR